MPDDDYGPPQGGGGFDFSWSNPWVKYGALAGAAIVVYVLYRRYRSGGSVSADGTSGGITTTTGSTPGIDPNTGLPYQQFAIDPTTGVPINPATGFDFGQVGSADTSLSTWITSAYNAMIGSGATPENASNALYAYLHGQPLSKAWENLINLALKNAGMPPGDVRKITVQTTGTTTSGNSYKSPGGAAMQGFVNAVYAYLHRGANYKGPKFTQAQINLAKLDVLTGKSYLPLGFTAPAGYVLNPTTRILTKKAA